MDVTELSYSLCFSSYYLPFPPTLIFLFLLIFTNLSSFISHKFLHFLFSFFSFIFFLVSFQFSCASFAFSSYYIVPHLLVILLLNVSSFSMFVSTILRSGCESVDRFSANFFCALPIPLCFTSALPILLIGKTLRILFCGRSCSWRLNFVTES